MPARWICSQIGAREHYAVARALHRSSRLESLYTDYWAGPVVRKFATASLRALALRYHPDLADTEVISWNFRTLCRQAGARFKSRHEDSAATYASFIAEGRKFSEATRDKFMRRKTLSSETLFFAYDTGALETLEFLRESGVKCIVDQMDPSRVEVNMVQAEEKRWPDWGRGVTEVPEEYFRRREQEWALADRVMVNSEFSRRALIEQGVSPKKLVVIPLCYETEISQSGMVREKPVISSARPVRVLFLGSVILRKGIQYLIEAAKLLGSAPVHFDVVGPIGISRDAKESAPPNVTFHGQVDRRQAIEWYRQSDIFVLPTLSDGFALTQLEAMAHGLPVITTPNCGEVVTNEQDGFIVPAGNIERLAVAISRYIEDRELLSIHQAAARQKASLFTLARLGENLQALAADLAPDISAI